MTLNTDYYDQADWYDPHGRQTTWSASYITNLQRCPRYYFYTKQGWKTKQKSIDLIFGSIFSAAVEFYYKLYTSGIAPEECLAQTVHAVMIESKKYRAFQTEELKTRPALVRAVVDYFDKYSALDGPHIKYNEQVFRIAISDNLWFTGKLDVVKATGDEYQVLDQKTTKSNLSPTYFNVWTPHNQMSLYLYAGQMIFPQPVRNIILDAVQIQKTGTKMMRAVIKRTKNQLDEWVGGVVREVGIAHQRDPNDEAAWPQNPNACGYFRGCEFREVCSQDPKLRTAYLKKDFDNANSQPKD